MRGMLLYSKPLDPDKRSLEGCYLGVKDMCVRWESTHFMIGAEKGAIGSGVAA